jgi:hypothetical protein
VLLNLSTMVVPQKASAQVSVSFQMSYDQLSPYGSWVDYPSYGYVWIPSAGPGFSPYGTGGHWVFTTYGWTWVSDYAWGMGAFPLWSLDVRSDVWLDLGSGYSVGTGMGPYGDQVLAIMAGLR